MDWLFQRMKENSDKPAIVWKDQTYTYKHLLERISEMDLPHGEIAGICGDYSFPTIALLIALLRQSSIVTVLAPLTEHKHDEFKKTAEIQRFYRDGGSEALGEGVANPLLKALLKQGDPGLIVFSSGTTGANKAALHDFNAVSEMFKKPMRPWRMLSFLLFDHLGGINTLFKTFANSGCLICLEDRSLEHICEQIEKHKVEVLPTNPTLLNLLLAQEMHKRRDLSSLKIISYGTEVMPENTLKRLKAAFPDTRLKNIYGLSETGVLPTESKSDTETWIKIGKSGKVETKVVNGVLWIKAKSTMIGYLNAPESSDKDGWFNTEDRVECAGEYVKILGRESDLVNIGGLKVYPSEIENVLLSMENVSDVCVYGEPSPFTGQMLVAEVVLKNQVSLVDLKKQAMKFCRARLEKFKIPSKFKIVDKPRLGGGLKKIRKRS